MSVIGDLAAFVCEANVANLPSTDRDLLRRHVTDATVAAVAGARTGEAAALRRLNPKPSAHEAVALGAAIIRHTEIDDIHLPSCTTPSSLAVPVALMLAAEEEWFDPDRVAAAIWVGTELIVRFGVAIDGPTVLYRGVWPTCVAAPLGAAAIAARVWQLDIKETEQALSLALMLTAGRTGRFHGAHSGRWVLFIGAIVEGLRAANAARRGFSGDPSLLDGPWLANAQGITADIGKLTANLGKTSVYPALSMKPFCTARQALGSTDALIGLLDDGLDPRSIEAVKVRVPPAYAGMISQAIDPANRSSGFVNAGFQMGLAAFRRPHLWDIDRRAVMSDADVLGFAKRVTVEADPALQASFPRQWPAEIEVLAGGRTIAAATPVATGDPDRRLDDTGIAAKAHKILNPLIGPGDTDTILSIAHRGFDNPDACRLLATTVSDALRK